MEDPVCVQLAVIQNDIKNITEKVDEINKKLEAQYVLRVEFEPVKWAVYGMVGLIGTTVIGAILWLVLKR